MLRPVVLRVKEPAGLTLFLKTTCALRIACEQQGGRPGGFLVNWRSFRSFRLGFLVKLPRPSMTSVSVRWLGLGVSPHRT